MIITEDNHKADAKVGFRDFQMQCQNLSHSSARSTSAPSINLISTQKVLFCPFSKGWPTKRSLWTGFPLPREF